jgi:hypothetical protein
MRMRTAIRCATLTKLPVALSDRSTANSGSRGRGQIFDMTGQSRAAERVDGE